MPIAAASPSKALLTLLVILGSSTPKPAYADSPVEVVGEGAMASIDGAKSNVEANADEKLSTPTATLDSEPLSNWTGDLYNDVRDSIVLVRAGDSEGTGFAFMTSRMIATAFHVIEGEPAPVVVLSSGKELPAKVVAWDEEWDLALLELAQPIDGEPLDVVAEGQVTVGAAVATIGNPWGAEQRKLPNSTAPVWALSHGIVSAPPGDLIQTDAPVNPGNSGGPLLTSTGRVVGVLVVRVEGSDGISFAVGSRHLVELATRIHRQGPYAVSNWWLNAEAYWMPLSEYQLSGLSLGVRVVHGSGLGISMRGGRLWGTRMVDSVLHHTSRNRWLAEGEVNYYLVHSPSLSLPIGLGAAMAWDAVTAYQISSANGLLVEQRTRGNEGTLRALFSLGIDTEVLSVHTALYAFGGETGARLGVGFLL
jgi:S1-C subfamily serine protease